jgi:hypothetical protein
MFLFRPSVWVAFVSMIAYWDHTALHGTFVYDDLGSIKSNVVVNGQVPFREVCTWNYREPFMQRLSRFVQWMLTTFFVRLQLR